MKNRMIWMSCCTIALYLVGCQEEPKFIMPENPHPFTEGLTTEGVGAGGGAKSGNREKSSEPEKTDATPGNSPDQEGNTAAEQQQETSSEN